MAKLPIIMFFTLYFLHSSTASRKQFERRLMAVENRLDVVNMEIFNFREGITHLWDSFDHLNKSSSCEQRFPKEVLHERDHNLSKEDENLKESTGDTDTELTEIKQKFYLAFRAEKRSRIFFQNAVRKEMKDHKTQTKNITSIFNASNINAKLTALEKETGKRLTALEEGSEKRQHGMEGKTNAIEEKIGNIEIKIQSLCVPQDKEINELKLKLQNLDAKYENMLEINENLKEKIESFEKCPAGWYPNLNTCYYLSSETATWFQAQEWCKSHRAKLVEYKNEYEVNFVLNMTKTLTKWDDGYWAGFWVGANDIDEEGSFVWDTTGTKFTNKYSILTTELQKWLPGQPDNLSVDEDCMMTLVNKNGQWNDGHCTTQLKFTCEKQIPLIL